MRRVAGEEHRRLAGAIAAADQGDVLARRASLASSGDAQ